MALSYDGYASHGALATGGSGTVTLSTTNSNDVIVLCVYVEKDGQAGPNTITGVSGGGLSWSRRSTQSWSLSTASLMEVWWAVAPSPLTNTVITFTFGGANDNYSAFAFGVTGANYPAPWDSNVSLPKENNGTASNPSVTGVSTTALNTFLFIFAASSSFWGVGNTPSGFTFAGTAPNTSGGADFTSAMGAYQIESAAQSGITIAMVAGTIPFGLIADALIQFVSAPPVTKAQATATIGF